MTTFTTGSSDAGMLTVALRYLHWGTEFNLLRLTAVRAVTRTPITGAAVSATSVRCPSS